MLTDQRAALVVAFRRRLEVSDDINVLALVKGEERYIFLYNDSNRSETLRLLGRYCLLYTSDAADE